MDATYFGSELTERENQILSLKIDPKHREDEACHAHSMWFDYAKLHPTQRVFLFADLYRKQTQEFYSTYVDVRTPELSSAFTPADIFASRDLTSMWLARGAADRAGARYTFVLWFAQERAINRTYKYFPRPNQLYGEEFEIDMSAAWQDSMSRQISYSKNANFLTQNYVGSTTQKRHLKFVIGQILARPPSHVNLLSRMFRERVLSPALVGDSFSPEVIAAAQAVTF